MAFALESKAATAAVFVNEPVLFGNETETVTVALCPAAMAPRLHEKLAYAKRAGTTSLRCGRTAERGRQCVGDGYLICQGRSEIADRHCIGRDRTGID